MNFSVNFLRRHQLDCTCVDFRNAAFNLAFPRRIGVQVGAHIQRIQHLLSQTHTITDGKRLGTG